MYYIRRVVSALPFGIYVPASERSIPAFNKNLCIFIPFGGGRLHRQRHCRGAAHKLNLRRTTTRGKTRKIYRHSWHRNYLRSAITYCEVSQPPRNRPRILVYIFVCTYTYTYIHNTYVYTLLLYCNIFPAGSRVTTALFYGQLYETLSLIPTSFPVFRFFLPIGRRFLSVFLTPRRFCYFYGLFFHLERRVDVVTYLNNTFFGAC